MHWPTKTLLKFEEDKNQNKITVTLLLKNYRKNDTGKAKVLVFTYTFCVNLLLSSFFLLNYKYKWIKKYILCLNRVQVQSSSSEIILETVMIGLDN